MIIKTDPDLIASYTRDESGLKGGFASRVYVPKNEDEVVLALKECASTGTPVYVSAGGTGVTGGRVPFGGAVISVELFNKTGEIRKLNGKEALLTAGAGVSIKELKEKAKASGWMYAPDPTEQGSFLGGNISTNASGSRGLKYGPTRNYIRKLKVVLSTGDILNIERGKIFAEGGRVKIPLYTGTLDLKLPSYELPAIKNAAGYYNYPGMDLVDLFIGQEGTLGVITEADVLLVPKIQRLLAGIAFFKVENRSWDFVMEIKRQSGDSRRAGDPEGIDAMSLEYFDKGALDLLSEDYDNVPKDSRAAIYFEQSISGAGSDAVMARWAEALASFDVPLESVWFGATEREEMYFREFRHRLPEKVNEIVRKNGYPKTGTDLAVPENSLKEMIAFYGSEIGRTGIRYLVFGHIGESHMHANFLPDNEEDYKKSKDVYLELAKKAVSLGGTVSAEHGIGKLKHMFLEAMIGKEGMDEMARVKATLDPAKILGLDNMFPKELLKKS